MWTPWLIGKNIFCTLHKQYILFWLFSIFLMSWQRIFILKKYIINRIEKIMYACMNLSMYTIWGLNKKLPQKHQCQMWNYSLFHYYKVFHCQQIHCVTLIPEQTSIYEVKYGYFNWIFHTLKVMPWSWPSGSQQIWIRTFKWGTIHQFWSRDCKNIKDQCQQFLTFSISLW